MGIDDYGSVPWPEPIPFQVTPNHPSGDATDLWRWPTTSKAWQLTWVELDRHLQNDCAGAEYVRLMMKSALPGRPPGPGTQVYYEI